MVGRDARTTGALCASVVAAALRSVGCDVIDAGLATTPTVEMAVLFEQAAGGVILSASHNPAEWNALKLLNEKGEFLSPEEGAEVIALAESGAFAWVGHEAVGAYRAADYLDRHLDAILALPYIRPERIAARGFKVLVDGVNSVGGVAVPALLGRLGVAPENIVCLHCEPTGRFAHPAEPLPENLTGAMAAVREHGADLGLVVDPDADRLALIEPGGAYVSEELTQVIVADYVWRHKKGPFVTNLSSSRAIDDVAARHGETVYRSAVGEINVVKRMQAVGAALGGEGNGGVIVPELHYGRDALAGIALVLQRLADDGATLSEVRAAMPVYRIVKRKADLSESADPDALLAEAAHAYRHERVDTTDGVKIDFADGWVHLRKSNTEPIVRLYAEAATEERAAALAEQFLPLLSR